jgi:hypothetical protein
MPYLGSIDTKCWHSDSNFYGMQCSFSFPSGDVHLQSPSMLCRWYQSTPKHHQENQESVTICRAASKGSIEAVLKKMYQKSCCIMYGELEALILEAPVGMELFTERVLQFVSSQ